MCSISAESVRPAQLCELVPLGPPFLGDSGGLLSGELAQVEGLYKLFLLQIGDKHIT